MAAVRPVVVCELLLYINSQFTRMSKSEISSVLNSFYTNDEVITAKKLLFDFADAMKEDYIPAYTERKGVNKQRANVDDIIARRTQSRTAALCCRRYESHPVVC